MKEINMKNKFKRSVVFTALGLIMVAVGFLLLRTMKESQGILETLPYILVGFGSGIFGLFLGDIISCKAIEKQPELLKNIEIEQNDERNMYINNKAKAKAYEVMIFVYGAVILTLSLMKIDLKFTLLLCLSYLFIVFTQVYYKVKYNKSM
jgi:hypothetical protein